MALTDRDAAQAKASDKQYKLTDGRGLFLLMHPNGGKYWRLAYRYAGKQKTLALGVYPDVSLTDARIRRDDARKLLANGTDPVAMKRAQKADKLAQSLALINPVFQLSMKDDALTIKTKRTTLALTPEQTAAVRTFLIATPNEGMA
jgi:Arm DNA-binding domain